MTKGVRTGSKLVGKSKSTALATVLPQFRIQNPEWQQPKPTMSAAIIESPLQTPTQLCFVWSEVDESPAAGSQETAGFSGLGQGSPVRSRRPDRLQPPTPSAWPIGSQRCGQVRMGEVMIKLLKRYGITDLEIEHGLAEYAAKNAASLAS